MIVEYAWDLPLSRRGWRCRCDCGKFSVVKYAMLRRGNSKSCGCAKADRFRALNAPNRRPSGEASFSCFLGNYRRNAAKRGFCFDLTEQEFRALTLGDCAYCGLAPVRAFTQARANGAYICNGVDRVENALGYTVQNSVSCCVDCNMAKGSMPAARWLAMLDRIAAFRGSAGLRPATRPQTHPEFGIEPAKVKPHCDLEGKA